MLTAQQVATGAVCYQCIPDKLAAIIYLLNGGAKTVSQIEAGAVQFQNVTDKRSASVFLLSGGATPSSVSASSASFRGMGQFLNSWIYVLNTGNLTPKQIASGSACYSCLTDKWGCIVSLLNSSGLTAKAIESGSACYQCLSAKESAILYLAANASPTPPPPSNNGLLNNLAAYWTFSSTSGLDFPAENNPSYLLSALSSAPTTSAGKVDNAVFIIDPTEVLVGNASFLSGSPITINYWAKYVSGYSVDFQVVFQILNASFSAGNASLYAQYISGVTLDMGLKNDGIGNFSITPSTDWIMVTAVRESIGVDGGHWLFYINGTLAYTADDFGEYSAGFSDFYIGNDSGNTAQWHGYACGFGFWNEALSATKISALYAGGSGLPYASFTA